MLRIVIEEAELYNEETQEFSNLDGEVIDLEHSLVSVSKWESEFQKPFLSAEPRSTEETFGYLRAMALTPLNDPNVLYRCSVEDMKRIQAYVESSQSATTFGVMPERRGPSEVITSELIYYWMIAFKIPFECQYWHLNRLFSLIRVCNIKNAPPRKMSRHEIAQRNRDLNAQRKAQLGTSG